MSAVLLRKHRRIMEHRIVAAFVPVLLFFAAQTSLAQTPPDSGNRATNDRDADLIKALITLGRFEDGIEVCEGMIGILDPTEDEAARWRIFLSQVHTAKSQAGQSFGDLEIEQAKQPVNDLINRYPDHRRRIFLSVQSINVEIAAARHAIVVASVSPAGNERQNQILQSTTGIGSAVDELIRKIREQASALLSNQPSLTDRSLAGDLKRLDHELQITSVSLKLMQSEIFQRDSADFVDAAGQAAIAAQETLERLPSNVPATLEIRRLLAESLVRAGQLDRAESELKTLLSQLGPNPPSIVRALMVQLLIAKGDRINADKILNSFFGNDLNAAPRSLPMDLARLQFLLSSDADDKASSVGDWLGAIEKRNGLFARRRAESIALSRLGKSSATNTMANPSLIAAQGEDWLRRGEPERGAKLLLAAAKAETNGKRALELGVKSAAAFLSIDQKENAAGVLAHIATSNPNAKGAAPLQLQAAVLMSQLGEKTKPESIEKTLRDLIRIWPDSPKASDAKRWLLKILDSSGRSLQAAKDSTRFLRENSGDEEINDSLRRWTELIYNSEETKTAEYIEQFGSEFSMANELSSKITGAYYRQGTLLLDASRLSRFNPPGKSRDEKFLASLSEFRRGKTSSVTIDGVDPKLIEIARWRLLRDGDENRIRRKPTAQLLQSWPVEDPWQRVRVQLWSGDEAGAIERIKQLLLTTKDPGGDRRRAADLLIAESTLPARYAAIDLLDQLATGLPKGSAEWHDAKLAVIDLLKMSGKSNEAVKQAKYILLTSPPKEDKMRTRYEEFAK